MLREGFDVNNICVIVPLRSSEAPILLEQIIGRGLRLMWREPVYQSTKEEDRKRVLGLHSQPKTYLDMLSIIEHPAFIRFYDELLEGGLAVEETGEAGEGGSTGDIIKVGSLVGVAKLDIKAGELGALAVVGVYEIATGGAVVAMGDVVSVDPATGKVVAAGASGAVKFGHAVTAATASDATVNVRLTQGLA
jgi:predicted RecA/RadA family phage recombinase